MDIGLFPNRTYEQVASFKERKKPSKASLSFSGIVLSVFVISIEDGLKSKTKNRPPIPNNSRKNDNANERYFTKTAVQGI
jgi:hypothetical protein